MFLLRIYTVPMGHLPTRLKEKLPDRGYKPEEGTKQRLVFESKISGEPWQNTQNEQKIKRELSWLRLTKETTALAEISVRADVKKVFVGNTYLSCMPTGRQSGKEQYGFTLTSISEKEWSEIGLRLHTGEFKSLDVGLPRFLDQLQLFIRASRTLNKLYRAVQLIQHQGGQGAMRLIGEAVTVMQNLAPRRE